MELNDQRRRRPNSRILIALCALLVQSNDFACLGFTITAVSSRDNRVLLHSAPPQTSDRQQSDNSNPNPSTGNPFLQWLAELSLEDYQWRSGIFKANAADRMLEESLARMRGENATYVRPMDATLLGPLGRWEKESVTWVSNVIEEEARRAQRIVANAGRLIRPLEIEDGEMLGPLGFLEKQIVEFFANIRRAEQERVRTKTLRPKDLDESFRGPLGELEIETVRIFEEIRESEKNRGEQIKARGGEMVRPIDVPGPLGELELRVAEIFDAERRRSQERLKKSVVVRPMDATFKGPLGEVEADAHDTLKSLSSEEMERLRNIRQFLLERRPMDTSRDSLLGLAETFLVGVVRAPRLISGVVDRVKELLQSEPLASEEKPPSSVPVKAENSSPLSKEDFQ